MLLVDCIVLPPLNRIRVHHTHTGTPTTAHAAIQIHLEKQQQGEDTGATTTTTTTTSTSDVPQSTVNAAVDDVQHTYNTNDGDGVSTTTTAAARQWLLLPRVGVRVRQVLSDIEGGGINSGPRCV